jgi:pyruvate/2-oxoglutarate dehydrogenase complex dihydrolipoamide acyltransferase (E2) component
VTAVVPTSGLAKLKQSNAAAELLSAAVIYECARLLRRYPHLNAYGADGKIHFYEEVNIGYALDAGQGLKVPVLRNADTKTMNSLVDERRQFVADYLNDAFRPESLAAATFTITDLSGDGVFTFDPLIVEGQSAILGIGGDFLLPGMTATAYNLILAFDHRLIEGRMAARFLNDLKDRLQAHEQAIAGSPQIANLQSEPYCSRCLSTLSAIQRLEGYLVHTVGGSKDETKLVCSHCLANV